MIILNIIHMNRTAPLLLFLMVCVFGQDDIFSKYYQEAKKIAESMTLDQKVGQMIQADFKTITNEEKETTNPDEAVTLQLGSLLINAIAAPTDDGNLARIPPLLQLDKHIGAFIKSTEANWKKLTDRFQSLGVSVTTQDKAKYKIKFLLGTDAVHGDQHTLGNVLFPHNIGLSCSKNEGNFQNLGFWTNKGVKRSGFNFVFSPTVATSHNPQWGRFYESLGQDDSLISKYAQSYVKGVQDVSGGKINGALATAKHFFADGATLYGTNQGNANVLSFKSFIDHNIAGYVGSAKSNVGSVMVSYSAINWVPNSINSQFLLGLLREDAGFRGFTISDYDDLERLSDLLLPRTAMNFTDESDAFAVMVNAGVDMFMVSKRATVERIFKHAKRLAERNQIPEERLNEAVTRILSVKFALGLVEKTTLNGESITLEEKIKPEPYFPLSSSGNEYLDSLQAVRESLVLLKNSNAVPIRNFQSSIKYVILVGEKIHNLNRFTRIQLFRNFDNIGMQAGGWSVTWQGWEGNDFYSGDNKAKSNASSVLDALKRIQDINKMEILYPNYTSLTNQVIIDEERRTYIDSLKNKRKDMNSRNTIIIGVFGQYPYAESVGDVNIPYCKSDTSLGCLYEPSLNPFAPSFQSKNLNVQLSNFQSDVVSTIKTQDKLIPFVSVLLTGRPVIINNLYGTSDAVIAAWLPGTSGGQGIVDAITGEYVIRPKDSNKNTLSVDWPRNMESLNNFPLYDTDGSVPKINDPLFTAGFGLSTAVGSNIIQE